MQKTSKKKEYKTRHDVVGKVILKELCKGLKFDYTNKRESVLENEMHKSLGNFEIQTDHLTLFRKLNIVSIY